MGIVDVPIPRLVYSVSVHRPMAEHATFADLVSGQLVYASAAFGARLRAAEDESARGAPHTGWDVLWRRYRAGGPIGMENEETVTLACDGDDGGEGLYDRLLTALEEHKLTEVTPHGQTARLGAPVSCRWKRWTLGYERGMRARLVPGGRDPRGVQPRTTPLMWCPECQEEMRPV